MKKTLLIVLGLMLSSVLFASGGGTGKNAAVKIIYAEGKIFYDEIYVTWSTEFEKVKCEFIIEGSEDGHDWRFRGKVKSKGDASSHSEYRFVDAKDENLQYYRIRRLDGAGSTVLSQFELEDYSINVSMEEIFIDNEKKLLLEYTVDQDQELMVRVYNRIGEQVVTKVMPFKTAGDYLYQMDISNLEKDYYVLVVTQVLLDKSVAEKSFRIE